VNSGDAAKKPLHIDRPRQHASSPRKRGSSRGARRSVKLTRKPLKAAQSSKPFSVVVFWMLAFASMTRFRRGRPFAAVCSSPANTKSIQLFSHDPVIQRSMQYNRLFEMVDRRSDVQVNLEPSGVAHGITNDPGAILAMNSFLHQAFG
jgi:hypothetical protein